MSTIVVTWDNPSDVSKAKAADAKAKDWRALVLKQPGLVQFNALTSLQSAGAGMAVDSFASPAAAAAFFSSDQFASIVSEMTAMGCTNIKMNLFHQHPDVPQPLKPA